MSERKSNATTGRVDPDVISQVARIPLFAGLTKTAITRLLGDVSVTVAPAGTVLFSQGEVADRFFVQLGGQIELFVTTPDGRESVIDVLGPGETFAEEAIFDIGIFPVGAKVVKEARILAVDARPFLDQLSEEFDLVLAMMAGMSRHLRVLLHQISELKLKSTAQRLGGFLLSLTDSKTGEIVVELPYDKRLLANRLGMKPESLSRALGKLQEIGVHDSEGELTISDVGSLRAFCLEGQAGNLR
jgi:CRP/FNR family transcriptional activator FtrB